MATPENGGRKFKAHLQAQLLTVLCFIIAGWMHMDKDLFIAVIVGVNGTSFGFMWGNVQEHKQAALAAKTA